MNVQMYDGRRSKVASMLLLSMLAVACSSSHKNPSDAGADAGSTTAAGGNGGMGGKGGSSGGTATGTAGTAATVMPMMMITCTEMPPTTPVMCGGEVCTAAAFGMNTCIIPCCVMEGSKEVCASRSAAMGFSTECTVPAVADPQCPDVTSMAAPLKGCCNAAQHKCGIISTLRPGCITESTLVMLPANPQSCSAGSDDGGTGLDGG
jgi:hypothetical protein